VPSRPHPIVLTALIAACIFVGLLLLPGGVGDAAAAATRRPPGQGPVASRVSAALAPRAHAAWRWPLHGPVAGPFRLTPRTPYARGQRRGIDIAAARGATVRAACAGRVTFIGALPRLGRAVSVRCGALMATYLRLARVTVRRGAVVTPGQPLGTVGRAGVLRLGARRTADRRGYLDPLTLLADPRPHWPVLGPAPRGSLARRRADPRPLPVATRARPLPAHPRGLPWPAYAALALIATALPIGGLVHRRRRAEAHPRSVEARELA
jgi:hypothetical protein